MKLFSFKFESESYVFLLKSQYKNYAGMSSKIVTYLVS
nr:MAG TPA: hypothetical protein [Bacteriophage sp.]